MLSGECYLEYWSYIYKQYYCNYTVAASQDATYNNNISIKFLATHLMIVYVILVQL